MKIKNKLFFLMIIIISYLFMSCSTIGNHLPIAHGDIDIRDIVWVTGRKVTPLDTEISATGKVIRTNTNEK